MSVCVFPGSFDPITRGHMDLIQRAAGLFDSVTVTVMVNISKKPCIPLENRIAMIRKACTGIPNVEVDLWEGLLADYMKNHPGWFVVRGVRNASEFEQEKTAAAINRQLYPGMETFLLPSDEELDCVSSSMVREIAGFGGDYSRFVPDGLYEEIGKWLNHGKAENIRKIREGGK